MPQSLRTAITHATVITMDDERRVLTDATILLEGDRIIEVGASSPAAPANAAIIDVGGGIVLPGLINTHCHAAMTLYRGQADDRSLQDFLAKLLPLEGATATEAHLAAGARLAVAEMLRSGTTTALDMYWHPEVSSAVAAEGGLRLVTGPIFIGGVGPDHLDFKARLAAAEAAVPAGWTMAHGTYTMSVAELEAVGHLAAAGPTRFHIHAAENQAEVDQVVATTGRRPVELLDELGLLGPTTVLAHAVALTDDEVARLGATRTAVAHCPMSNMKLASGVCRVADLQAAGATVALGTDGASSSNDLDLFGAMRAAALLAKVSSLDPTALSAQRVLEMATIEGAAALGLDPDLGSIAVGKLADLVLLDPASPSLNPVVDPISAVVYAASRADVTDVWVGGDHVVAKRQLQHIDLSAAISAVDQIVAGFPSA